MTRTVMLWLVYFSLLLTSVLTAQPDPVLVRDTLNFHLSPITIHPMQARERESPVTFSNLSAEQINERYSVQDIPVLLSELPSITSYSENGNGIGYNYISMRGFDQRRISVMVNGIPQNDPEDHNVYWIDFPDLLSTVGEIQVQRGAGSAFYGPPAIGGSVNLVTNPFAQRHRVTIESMVGFQEIGDGSASPILNTRKYLASINSGLIENRYLLYGKLGRLTTSGYRVGSWAEMNSYFFGAMRVDSGMSTSIHIYGGPISDGLAYTGLPAFVKSDPSLRRANYSEWGLNPDGSSYSYSAGRRPQEIENFSQPHYELLHEWRLSPTLTLSNTLFHYTGTGFFDYAGDWVLGGFFDGSSQWQWYSRPATEWFSRYVGYDTLAYYPFDTSRVTPTLNIRGSVANSQWGWMPRLEIGHANGSLTIGSEIRFHRSTHSGSIPFASEYPSSTFDPNFRFYEYQGEKDMLSFYLHELYHPGESITLLADLQLAYNRYGIRNEKFIATSFSIPYLFLNPRFGVNINWTDAASSYFSLAYTSREPRLRNLYAAEDAYFGALPQFRTETIGTTSRYLFDEPLAKPEQLFDLEVGTHWRSENTRLSVNIYWMEFTNELVKSGQVDIFGQPVTGNAVRTRHLGIEAEGLLAMGRGFTIGGNIAFSRNRLIRHQVFVPEIDSTGNVFYTPTSLDGNPIAGFPDLLSNIRLTWRSESITASTVAKYVGGYYTDNFKNELNKNTSYAVVNAELLYRVPELFESDLTLRVEVRNVLNNLYFSGGEGNAFFPAAERNYLLGLTFGI